jgi:hypothetical protein
MYPFICHETVTSLFELTCLFSTVLAVLVSHVLTSRL